jgi:hypothetical protein
MKTLFDVAAACRVSDRAPPRVPFFGASCAGCLFVILYSAVATALTPTLDPTGDTFGVGAVQHDIVAVNTALSDSELTFEIEFDGSIAQPTSFQQNVLAGFIDLDLDANPATGITSHVTQFGQGPSGLGVDFFVDLFSEGDALLPDGVTLRMPGQVELVDTSGAIAAGVLSADYGPKTVSVSIPRSLLTDISIPFQWGIVVGTLDEATDQVLGSTVPEPATALPMILGAAAGIFGPRGRKRRATRRLAKLMIR